MKFINRNMSEIGQNVQKEPFLLDKWDIFVAVILVIGMLIRIIGISDMPNAFNCDEASAGYEAFSILNYGIDRNRK